MHGLEQIDPKYKIKLPPTCMVVLSFYVMREILYL